MRATPIPELVAQKTISIPHEPAAVMGFTGRNKVLGRDVLILKRDAIPTDGPFVGIPPEQADLVTTERYDVFVTSDSRVIGVSASRFESVAATHSFDDWHGKEVSVLSFHGEDATVWSRNNVEVTV